MDFRFAKRVACIGGGFTLLALGAAMLVLPGPGWVAIGVGLTLLATEYAWARRWLDGVKKSAKHLKSRVTR